MLLTRIRIAHRVVVQGSRIPGCRVVWDETRLCCRVTIRSNIAFSRSHTQRRWARFADIIDTARVKPFTAVWKVFTVAHVPLCSGTAITHAFLRCDNCSAEFPNAEGCGNR